jgi:hypothetical protein
MRAAEKVKGFEGGKFKPFLLFLYMVFLYIINTKKQPLIEHYIKLFYPKNL